MVTQENGGPLGSKGLGSIELGRSHNFYIYLSQNKALQNTLQSNYTCEETKGEIFKELSEITELPQTGMCKIWVSPERKEYSAIFMTSSRQILKIQYRERSGMIRRNLLELESCLPTTLSIYRVIVKESKRNGEKNVIFPIKQFRESLSPYGI